MVGVADTGIDMYNRFFYDDTKGSGSGSGSAQLVYQTSLSTLVTNPTHRKVYQYITYGDNREDSAGHGSHVSGSIAGKLSLSSSSASTSASVMSYAKANGISPNAKIAFFDIGIQGEEYLYTPLDLNKDMFTRMLISSPFSCKVYSNSWGSSANYYDLDAKTSDMFQWQHPETLIFFAAGNDGEYGINTVGSPATGKNSLAIGAGMSDEESWTYLYGSYQGNV
jgi:hypothetical protein